MVKRIFVLSTFLLTAAYLTLGGCSKSSTPVSPLKGGSGVLLNMSGIQKAVKSAAITDPYIITIKYNIQGADGTSVKGSKEFGAQYWDEAPKPLQVALPRPGKYLVAIECFYKYNETYPQKGSVSPVDGAMLLGAAEVDVDGLTPINMPLGRLDTECYDHTSYNWGNALYADSYFTFDESYQSYGGTGDVYFPPYDSLYTNRLETVGNDPTIAYLGNGDLVDFPRIPASAEFFYDTYSAKGNQPIALGDVYGIKVPSKNGLVWLQVTEIMASNSGGYYVEVSKKKAVKGTAARAQGVKALNYGDTIGFRYRYQDDGKDHYAYDQTTYGTLNCNDNYWDSVPSLPVQTGYWTPVSMGLGGFDVDNAGRMYLSNWSGCQILDPLGTTTTVSGTSNVVGVAVSKAAPVTAYVADAGVSLIHRVVNGGTSITGSIPVNGPRGVALDGANNVYVTYEYYDGYNYPYNFAGVVVFNQAGSTIASWGEYGNGLGQLNQPNGITVESTGNVLVADSGNQRVLRFSPTGAYLGQIGGINTFGYPNDVATDAAGNVWITDQSWGYLWEFNSGGTLVGNWYYTTPVGVAFGSTGALYLGDNYNYALRVMGP